MDLSARGANIFDVICRLDFPYKKIIEIAFLSNARQLLP